MNISIITIMNIYAMDIRLLLIFDAVMRERNVTRAASQIGLTQPAVSNALNRLRAILNDELFERTPQGMRPTARALELAGPVSRAMQELESAVVPTLFQPVTAVQTVNIAMSDQVGVVILPSLENRLEREAPGITVRIRPKVDSEVAGLLESGAVDIAIGVFHEHLPRFRYAALYSDKYVSVVRSGHALAKRRFALEDFLNARHLLVRSSGDATGYVDAVMEREGLRRRVVMSTGQVLAVPGIIRKSNAVAVLLQRTANHLHDKTLVQMQLPFKVAPAEVSMMWHPSMHENTANRWMRKLLAEVCAG